MAATGGNDAGASEVLEQGPREPGRLAAFGRSRAVRLAAGGLLATAAVGWLVLGAGAGPPDSSPPPADRPASTGEARPEPTIPGRARQLAASLYRFARNPAPAARVPWARDVALTAPGAWVVVPRSRAAHRTAWTTVSGRTGEYLLADLADSGGRYRADDTRHVDCRARPRAARTPAYGATWISVQALASVPCSSWWAVDVFLDEHQRIARVTVTTR